MTGGVGESQPPGEIGQDQAPLDLAVQLGRADGHRDPDGRTMGGGQVGLAVSLPAGGDLRLGAAWDSISVVITGEKALFSDAEMRRRRAAFGTELERAGVSHALVYGANRSGSAVSWLTGWPVTREALLLAGPDPEQDVLLVSFFNHVPQARRLATVPVEFAGPLAVVTALDLLAGRGGLPGRVGVAGALPFDQYRILAERIPEVADLNPACTRLRLVKSEEEIAALRRGAALSDAAIAALAAALRPGVTDHEVLAQVERAYVSQGGMHYIHYVGITCLDEPAAGVPAQWPTGRVIRERDVVTCEISAAAAPEYAGQVLRTFTVGADPTALYAKLHAAADAAFEAMAARLAPGTAAGDLAAAGSAILAGAGFTAIDDLAHGFGGGYLPPVIPAPGRSLAAPDFTLAAGMTLVVQPNVVTSDLRAGVQTGELLLITENGHERLHAFPRGFHRAG